MPLQNRMSFPYGIIFRISGMVSASCGESSTIVDDEGPAVII